LVALRPVPGLQV
jgi:hypothetical protein